MSKRKRFIVWVLTFIPLILVPFAFWMSGYNFERNDTGVACVLVTILAMFLFGSIANDCTED